MLACVRGIIADARSPHSADATRCRIRIATPVDRTDRFARVVPRPRRPTDFLSVGQKNYERTQEVAGRFRRVALSRKIRELRVALIHRQAPAGTGMVTGWRLTDTQLRQVTYEFPRLRVGPPPVAIVAERASYLG